MNQELHTAARMGDLPVLKALIEQGANINELGPHKWSPLIAAAVGGHTETVRWLLDVGAITESLSPENGRNALHWAALVGCAESVNFLLEQGFEVDAPDTYANYTPLHLANGETRWETIRVIVALLDHGANINARNKHGNTPLGKACGYGIIEIITLLLDQGADINSQNNEGNTVLMTLAQNTQINKRVVKLLIERGADIEMEDVTGKTALLIAASHGNAEMVELLLENGAVLNKRDSEGKTALMHAAGIPPESSCLGILIRVSASSKKR